MTETATIDEKAVFATAELIGKLSESGSRVVEGIYSTPWTGVPFTLMLLAGLEKTFPGITQKFVDAMGQFMGMIANMVYNALKGLAIFSGATGPGSGASGPGKPDINIPAGTGKYCIQWTPQLWVQIVQSVSGFPTAGAEACYVDQAARDAQLALLNNDGTKTWYWTFRAVDH